VKLPSGGIDLLFPCVPKNSLRHGASDTGTQSRQVTQPQAPIPVGTQAWADLAPVHCTSRAAPLTPPGCQRCNSLSPAGVVAGLPRPPGDGLKQGSPLLGSASPPSPVCSFLCSLRGDPGRRGWAGPWHWAQTNMCATVALLCWIFHESATSKTRRLASPLFEHALGVLCIAWLLADEASSSSILPEPLPMGYVHLAGVEAAKELLSPTIPFSSHLANCPRTSLGTLSPSCSARWSDKRPATPEAKDRSSVVDAPLDRSNWRGVQAPRLHMMTADLFQKVSLTRSLAFFHGHMCHASGV
jgi:hypothetical protein